MATASCQQLQQQHGDPNNDDDQEFDMAALNQFDYIRFTLTDMNGIGRCMSVPRRHVEHCLHDGLGVYAGKSTSQTPHPMHLQLISHSVQECCSSRIVRMT